MENFSRFIRSMINLSTISPQEIATFGLFTPTNRSSRGNHSNRFLFLQILNANPPFPLTIQNYRWVPIRLIGFKHPTPIRNRFQNYPSVSTECSCQTRYHSVTCYDQIAYTHYCCRIDKSVRSPVKSFTEIPAPVELSSCNLPSEFTVAVTRPYVLMLINDASSARDEEASSIIND